MFFFKFTTQLLLFFIFWVYLLSVSSLFENVGSSETLESLAAPQWFPLERTQEHQLKRSSHLFPSCVYYFSSEVWTVIRRDLCVINLSPTRACCQNHISVYFSTISVFALQYYVSQTHRSTQVRSCYSGMPPPSYPCSKQYNHTNCHGNIFQCRHERMCGVYTANYSHSLWPMFRVLGQDTRFMSETGRSGWGVILSQGWLK